jgi:hypothetical protein
MVRKKLETKFSKVPVVRISYEKGFTNFQYPKTIEVVFYKWVDLESLQDNHRESYEEAYENFTSMDMKTAKANISTFAKEIKSEINSLQSKMTMD